MKTSTFLASLLLLAGLQPVFPQTLAKFRYRHHPSYSPNNYKQPAEASLSRKVGQDPGQTIDRQEWSRIEVNALNRNYKPQFSAQWASLPDHRKGSVKIKHRASHRKGRFTETELTAAVIQNA